MNVSPISIGTLVVKFVLSIMKVDVGKRIISWEEFGRNVHIIETISVLRASLAEAIHSYSSNGRSRQGSRMLCAGEQE